MQRSSITTRQCSPYLRRNVWLGYCALLVAALYLLSPLPASGQGSDSSLSAVGASVSAGTDSGSAESTFVKPPQASKKPHVESDLTVEGLVSYGNYRLLASGENSKVYNLGIEYARHSWGRFLGGRMDYVAEIMPFVLLNQPTKMDIWGDTMSASRKTVPGIDIAPIGLRWLWREGKGIKPYLTAKGGILLTTQKALSDRATYENISLQSAGGFQVKMNQRYDLRLGLFGDFHFSDGFIVPANPGLDVMNAMLGVTYHLGSGRGHGKAH